MPQRLAISALPCLLLLCAAVRAFDEDPSQPLPPEKRPTAANKPGNSNLLNLKVTSKARVMVIPVNDDETTRTQMIDVWQAGFVGRRLHEAEREKYDLVILEIDTHGGDLFACDKINTALHACKVPTLAFITDRAFSGGAIISLGTRGIGMAPGAQIGGALAVGPNSDLQPDQRRKVREYLIKMMEGLGERNDYPVAIARGMVDAESEVVETDDPTHRFATREELDNWSKQVSTRGPVPNVLSVWKKSDSVLSLTAQQAYDANLSSGIYADRNAMLTGMGVQPAEVFVNDITVTEKITRFFSHPGWLVFFVIVGLIGLIWEIKSPGHGIGYGVFGLCLGLFFWLAIFAETAGTAELILFGLGALLLGLEIFVIPGFGVAGIAGTALVLLSILLSFLPEGTLPSFFNAPGEIHPFQAEQINYGLTWALVTLLACLGLLIFMLVFGIKLPGLARMALKSEVVPSPDGTAALALGTQPSYTPAYPETAKGRAPPAAAQLAEAPAALAELLGKEGQAESVLRPAGKVRIDGVSYDALSEGDWIETGRKIKVLDVRGTGLVVRAV